MCDIILNIAAIREGLKFSCLHYIGLGATNKR